MRRLRPPAGETDAQRRQRQRRESDREFADAKARGLTSKSTPGNVVQKIAATELERVSRAAARSRPTDAAMTFFTKEQREKLLVQAEEHRLSLRRPKDRRFVADLEAGRPYKIAKAKLLSRLRAAAQRWAYQPARAAKDLELNKRWAEAHDHLLEGAELEGGDAFEDVHEHRFEGDEGL